MIRQKTAPARQDAFSIIEVLVSGALIGVVLTGLVANMIMTQRIIENNYRRAKATDYANSCLNRFRAARDNLEWPFFCQRMVTGWSTSGTSISYGGSEVDPICPVCEIKSAGTTEYCKYIIKFGKYDYDGNPTRLTSTKADIKGANYCQGDRDHAGFYIDITVEYPDSQGNNQKVNIGEFFRRGSFDAEYKP